MLYYIAVVYICLLTVVVSMFSSVTEFSVGAGSSGADGSILESAAPCSANTSYL